ncbi:hypothetical protein [Rhizobium sp. YTU87027]|uniref:hypothetical protein n=1 Tax=Rhizobium sp. YTU87027 TaxID=3417741 RepID=UPI003D695213
MRRSLARNTAFALAAITLVVSMSTLRSCGLDLLAGRIAFRLTNDGMGGNLICPIR